MKTRWTDNEIRILRKFYPDNYTSYVAKMLGKSESQVYNKAYWLGLKKSDAFNEKELRQRQGQLLKKMGEKSRFPKGHVPANKGKPMPAKVYEKAKATMFKKGQLPHNVRYDGHERISVDGYVEIRVDVGKYVLKHRLVWEQANGPIPKGMALVFKDGNKQHIELSNLELVTRAELLKRNSICRFPPELRSAIHQVHKLKRIINEKQN